jgi:trans-2,3-dihydro-3-hydroxyanthranilate isomerase
MSTAVSIFQIDAFADRPFAGNPAGVVLDAGRLTDPQMQSIATEMNLAETAFVSPTKRPGAELRLRWFTPGREVTYCGHATVATVHAMVETGRLGSDRVVFDTLGGLLPVSVERRPEGPLIWLEPAVPECRGYAAPLDELLEALGPEPARLGAWAVPAITPEADLLLPARDLASLHALAPDMTRLARLAEERRLRGTCVVSLETVDPGSAVHSRFFAPSFGIPEDIVTGSVHSSLGIWLLEAGRLSLENGLARFTAEQGDCRGRPGRLTVEVRASGGRATAVRVGGRAVTVLSGSIRVS